MRVAFGTLFVIATLLLICSAWRVGRSGYFATLATLGAALVVGEVSSTSADGRILRLCFDVIFFGFVFYYVSVQKFMGRSASNITTRDEYRDALVEQEKFTGFAKFIYHLPIPLFICAIVIATIGAYQDA